MLTCNVVHGRKYGRMPFLTPPMTHVCASENRTQVRGYWHQRADEKLGDPSPRWIQEPLVVRDRDGRLPRGPPGGALLLCV